MTYATHGTKCGPIPSRDGRSMTETLHGITRQERDEATIQAQKATIANLRAALVNIKIGSFDAWVRNEVDQALREDG